MSTHTLPPSADPAGHKAGGTPIYIAFVPWVLFAVVSHRDTLLAGAVVALLAAVAVCAYSARGSTPKLPELAAVGTFAAFTVVALLVSGSVADDVSRYARAIAAAMLSLITFASLLGTPFTEAYARESVPREHWSSPAFKAINRRLTIMWGCVFAAMVPAHVLAGIIDTRRADTLLNWVVPIVLLTWAVKRTGEVSSQAR